MTSRTSVERTSDRELVATRVVDGPAHLVFEAWTKPELIMRWWAPASFGITFLSCETDVRTGGSYRFVFGHAVAVRCLNLLPRGQLSGHRVSDWLVLCDKRHGFGDALHGGFVLRCNRSEHCVRCVPGWIRLSDRLFFSHTIHVHRIIILSCQ